MTADETTLATPAVASGLLVRVLIVDDDPDHQMLMSRALERHGMSIGVAGDGATAIAEVEQRDYDVVLVDYQLPDTVGTDLAAVLRDREDPPAVVLVTAQGSADVIVTALREGVADYVTKDHRYLQDLPAVVGRAWHQRDLRRRAREMQRLALLVSDAAGVADACVQIADGARRLLRAEHTVIAVEASARLQPEASSGPEGESNRDLLDRVYRALPELGEGGVLPDGTLVVTLPAHNDEPLGVLVAQGLPDHRAELREELELARTFAAFAGTALRNLRRSEIERSLVGELQRTMEARRDFVASVSHELRTPLTSIGGYAETVLDRWDQLDDASRRDFIGRVRTNAGELGRIIEELIDLASLERGRSFTAHPDILELRAAVGSAVDAMDHFTEGREISVDVPEVQVIADPDMLHRTLANLLSNAIKYSSPGSRIELTGMVEDPYVRLAVTDQGIGMSSGDAARVFEPFFRSPYAVANAVRGSGIGLSLVREYVRSMGGKITLDSELGEGSTFTFTVPLA